MLPWTLYSHVLVVAKHEVTDVVWGQTGHQNTSFLLELLPLAVLTPTQLVFIVLSEIFFCHYALVTPSTWRCPSLPQLPVTSTLTFISLLANASFHLHWFSFHPVNKDHHVICIYHSPRRFRFSLNWPVTMIYRPVFVIQRIQPAPWICILCI